MKEAGEEEAGEEEASMDLKEEIELTLSDILGPVLIT